MDSSDSHVRVYENTFGWLIELSLIAKNSSSRFNEAQQGPLAEMEHKKVFCVWCDI